MFINMDFEDDCYLIVPPDSTNNNFSIKVVSEKDKIDFPHLHSHIYSSKVKAEIECLKLEIMHITDKNSKDTLKNILKEYLIMYPEYAI